MASPPNWLELPVDVSASIIRRLDVVEILTSVQCVCSTWRRICRDPSMWRYINIIMGADHHSKLYRLAVDLSSGTLLGITIEAPHGLLWYITNRSMHLRCVRLVYCTCARSMEFVVLARKFPYLEALELSYCEAITCEVVDIVGIQCPLLKSFKLNDRGSKCSYAAYDYDAFAIAKSMSGLHHLQIFGNKLTNVGLIAILDGCRQLESLDLRHCFHVNLDSDSDLKRRCSEQIKHFRGPNDSTDDYPFDTKIHQLSDDVDPHAGSDLEFFSASEDENFGFFEEGDDEDLVVESMYELHL